MSRYCDKSCKFSGPVCDFCLHFLFYRDKDGMNIDGSGWCGLKREVTDAGSGCNDYYCKARWRRDQRKMFKEKRRKK